MDDEVECKCIKIIGHLEAVKWLLYPRPYRPSQGPLALGDWTDDPYIWLHYVESSDGVVAEDDVLKNADTRHWSIKDVQRYFFGDLHCEKILFTYQYPNLRVPTPHGSYLWTANTALKLHNKLYQKEFNMSLEVTLKKMEAMEHQMDRLIISDQLIKIERLDYFKRQTFFRILLNIMSFQKSLQLVSFENLLCKRLEGVRLIQQLACFNSHSLKYLFLWRFVLPNENPLLINYSYITDIIIHSLLAACQLHFRNIKTIQHPLFGYTFFTFWKPEVSGSGEYIPRPGSRRCFIRCLAELRNLRVLALEYSHIADGTGGALISLLPVIKRPHFRLELMCREDHIPGRTDAALGTGGHGIPDTVWRRVVIACPDLFLLMVFFRIYDYDNIRRFLSPSVSLREAHWLLGVDLRQVQRQDSDVSCFVRHLAYTSASTLVTLSIHQWRFAKFPLRRVLELMPGLVRFLYVGQVEDDVDLKRMFNIIASGVCHRLKQLHIQIQDTEARRSYWEDSLKSLTAKYSDIMKLFEIDFCLCLYKL